MGEVYLAWDTRLERDVALKMLFDSVCADSVARERLIREARAASKLSHPNVVTIYSIESLGNCDGIVMEYVDGLPLDQWRSLPERIPVELTAVARQIASGLAAAHAAGIIHRDLKPGNVLVDKSGRARILDFGLALMNEGARLTRSGALVGSPAYMSPEQIQGLQVDYRSDIFSYGILLYELLSGSHPFWAESETAILFAIVNDAPHPHPDAKPLVGEWKEIVIRCLAKDPRARYQKTSELVEALAMISDGVSLAGGMAYPLLNQGAYSLGLRAAPSIAVLPMIDLSPGKDQEYFCDGLSEELINELSRLSGLRVVARTSAFAFKGQSLDVRSIGSRLGVSHVLEGSVRTSGNRLRISAQLINVVDGYQLWSERFDRNADDVFTVQDEIARTVANRLRVQLGSQPSPPTHDLEAYNLYLQGRHHWNKRTDAAMKKALECFEAAIARDPQFAPAYAGIASTWLILEDHGFIGFRDAIAKARAMVERALAIDDKLAEGHTVMGAIFAELRQFEDSDHEFRRAIESNPGYATAHHWYSTQLLLDTGRVEDAEREILQARELDPLSLIINTDLARHHYYMRRFDSTESTLRHVFAIDAHFIKARRLNFLTLLQMERYSEAIEQIPYWLPSYVGATDIATNWEELLRDSGFQGVQRRLLEIMTNATRGYPLHYAIACAHAQLGEADAALDWLEKSAESRTPNLAGMRMDAMLDPLRQHPRFIALLKRLSG